jgi:hypothetical protein
MGLTDDFQALRRIESMDIDTPYFTAIGAGIENVNFRLSGT